MEDLVRTDRMSLWGWRSVCFPVFCAQYAKRQTFFHRSDMDTETLDQTVKGRHVNGLFRRPRRACVRHPVLSTV